MYILYIHNVHRYTSYEPSKFKRYDGASREMANIQTTQKNIKEIYLKK